MQEIYKDLKAERQALVAKFNETESEEVRKDLNSQIEQCSERMDKLVAKLEQDVKFQENAARAAELVSSNEVEKKDGEDLTNQLRSIVENPESRAAIEVPTFLDADTAYGSKILPTTKVQEFLGLFDLGIAPYRAYTENVQSLGELTFADLTETGTIGENSPTLSNAALTVAKKGVIIAITNEVSDAIPQIESDIVSRANTAYVKLLRSLIAASLSSADNTTVAAAANVTVEEAIQLVYDVPAEDHGDLVLLASPSAMADIATDTGNDNFYFDPSTNNHIVKGSPVYRTPGLPTGVLLAAVSPKAITAKASGLRVARSNEYYFDTDKIAFRTTTYAGAVINDQDYVNVLTPAV